MGGWQTKSLGEVLKLEYGKPLPKDKRAEDGDYPAYGANGVKCRTNEYYWNKPSIIIGRKGSAGEVNLSEDVFWPLDVTYFVVFDENKHDRIFLYHALESLELTKLAKGVKPGLNRNEVYAIEFSFPPLPEQKRIVTILDEALAGIASAVANTEKNLANARELFETHLNNVFTQKGDGWVEKTLEQIGTTQTGSTPKTSDKENYGDFIPFVKPADFNRDGSLDYKNNGLSKKGFEKVRKVAAGSALMVCIGATIGKCGYTDRDITTNQQINALTPAKGLSCKLIYYQMLTDDFQNRVLRNSGQATLPIINKKKWSALTVLFPKTLDEQKRIVANFDTILAETQRLESIYRKKLDALSELKQSILQKAFSGELTGKPDKILAEVGV